MFRPFQTTKGDLGNGLGLYVSKNILDRLGGDLKVESTVHVGTRVTAYLPRVMRPAAASPALVETEIESR
ncbi:ATP-binding protein [Acidobacteria bacterium AB60]|nr:ATP-binding protein [Acidobacteria bacterium AB60]